MRKKYRSLLWALLALLLCACGKAPEDGESPDESVPLQADVLTVRTGEAQTTLDPAAVTARGGETILYHLYENLLRWEDGGDGWAVLAKGQAENYTLETDYAGNATYTFTLREDAVWSDGTAVKAQDFVFAWQRLADPANDLPHRELLSEIAGFAEVQETGDPSLLAVSAPDGKTLTVTLQGSPAYFLEEICAGAYTMPLRSDVSSYANPTVTNGAYTLSGFTRELVSLERSETYCPSASKGPSQLHFATMADSAADYAALQAGESALVLDLPEEPLRALADSGVWTPEPATGTCAVVLNTRQAPFDNPNIRLAFHLAVDRQAIVDALGGLTSRPAPGVVPYGVSDYSSSRPVVEVPDEDSTPADPMAEPEPEKPRPTCWDFRTHSLEVVTADHTHDYETDCRYAQALLAQAGYSGGSGFPEVEYLYPSSHPEGQALAGLLQTMWRDSLGVSVTVRGVSDEEYESAFLPALPEENGEEDSGTETNGGEEPLPAPPFQMAVRELSPAYSDAEALLRQWYSGSGDNVSGFASDAFDILLDSARAAVSPDVRDACLHDAEAILLEASPVIPLFCRGGSYQLADGLAGLYRAPDGVFFLQDVRLEAPAG